MEGILKTV